VRRERGAVAVIICLVVAVIVGMAALCVDLGMQRVVRSDMQSVADVTALDMARLLATTSPGSAAWRDALRASLDRNDSTLGHRPSVAPGPDWVCTARVCARATAGWVDGDHVFTTTPPAPAAVYTGVRVESAAVVDFDFTTGSGGAARVAVARTAAPTVCFSVGTTTLALDTSGSALSPLLDHLLRVKLGAVGYAGLVGAKSIQVPLAGLMTELGVGTVDQLATTRVGIGQLTLAAVHAVQAARPTADVSALDPLLHLGAAVPDIVLGDILAVTSGGATAGLTGEVNALSLVTAAVVAANSSHAVDAELSVPGITGAKVSLIEPPRIACGSPSDPTRPVAHSAQIRLHLTAPLAATPSTSTLGLVDGGVDLRLEVGAGTATLTGLGCGASPTATFDVDTAGASVLPPVAPAYGQVRLNLTLARFMQAIPGLGLALKLALQALGVDPVGLDVLVGAQIASAHRTGVVVSYPAAPALPAGVTVTGNASVLHLNGLGVRLAGGSSGIASLLGALLAPTLDALLTNTVGPLLNTAVDPLLVTTSGPVLSALGISLADSEVDVLGRPACDAVELAG
jgi:uncharacterized membrane protein